MGHTHLEFSLLWRHRPQTASWTLGKPSRRPSVLLNNYWPRQRRGQYPSGAALGVRHPEVATPINPTREGAGGSGRTAIHLTGALRAAPETGRPNRTAAPTSTLPVWSFRKRRTKSRSACPPPGEPTQSLYGTEHLAPEPKRYTAGHAVTT